jgi:hypothetical protein
MQPDGNPLVSTIFFKKITWKAVIIIQNFDGFVTQNITT